MASRRQQPLITAAFIIGLAIALVTLRLGSDLHSPTLFLVKAVFPQLTFAFIAAIFIACLTLRSSYTSIASVLALIILLPFTLPSYSYKRQTIAPNAISVATFSTMTRTENHQDVVIFAKQKNPDVLCLQEVSEVHQQSLKDGLAPIYKYSVLNQNNLAIFSHFPIKMVKDHSAFFSAEVDTPQLGTTTFINTHMPRQYRQDKIDGDWQNLLTSFDEINTDNTVICGDLNLTPNNSMYELITGHYRFDDALKHGYSFTFPNAQRSIALFGPFIRIDYLLSKNLIAYNTQTLNVSDLSDHRAVMTHYQQ